MVKKGIVLCVLVLAMLEVLSFGAKAGDWVRADLYTGADSPQFFVDLDNVHLKAEGAAYLMKVIRPDGSYMEVALTVQCRGKGTSIEEVMEFNDGGKLIAHYHRLKFRLEMKEDAVFEILHIASCDGEKVNPLEKIKRLSGIRDYVFSRTKGKK
jgi:hypothetical protein